MDSAKRKELRDAYKSKPMIGGVCCIRCSGNHRVLLQATRNIEGLRNRFNFAMSTQTSPDPSLRAEWEKYGNEAFSFSVLEEIRKGEDQSEADFKDDIDVLYEIWLEKLKPEMEASLR